MEAQLLNAHRIALQARVHLALDVPLDRLVEKERQDDRQRDGCGNDGQTPRCPLAKARDPESTEGAIVESLNAAHASLLANGLPRSLHRASRRPRVVATCSKTAMATVRGRPGRFLGRSLGRIVVALFGSAVLAAVGTSAS